MALQAILKWQNDDSTADLNRRFGELFKRGVLTGGTLSVVPGQLAVDVQPFECMSNDGMLVQDTLATRLTVPLDQTSYIALKAKHIIGDVPLLEWHVVEASVFVGLIDRDDYVVFATVTKNSPAVEFQPTDISYDLREEQDRRGRDTLRGRLATALDLPTDPNFIKPGDMFIITDGTGDEATIYAWNGVTWQNITNTGTIAADLAQHRANLFPNEIHLTDAQADAALGSFGSPSAINRYVTETDPRLPTQAENDALAGSHGAPGNANRYVTEEYPVAAPTRLDYPLPPGGSVLIPAVEGPVYVGLGGVGSANTFFAFMDGALDLGYVNTSGVAPSVNGIFTDAFLTIPLDPSSNINVDANGFFTGDLYLSLDHVIDSASRLVYGKRDVLKTVSREVSIAPTPAISVVPALAIESIANIKGRDFLDPTPTREQNINLRSDIDALGSYLGTVLETNVVAAKEDFERLSEDPIYGPDFVENVGVDPIFTFSNTGLVAFSYTSGTVSFGAAVNLSGVRVGDLFRDGGGSFYLVTAVDDTLDTLDIASIETGLAPSSIVTSVGSALDGSTRINFNPRNVLLSEMKLSFGSEVIKTDYLYRLDEFSKPGGQVAFGIKTDHSRLDPRLVFFGGWENYQVPSTRARYVRNDGANGEILVTGFFDTVALLIRKRPNSPPLAVSIDGQAPSIVSTSFVGSASTNVADDRGPKYHRVTLASGLPTDRPSTVSATINADTAGSLDVYGICLTRTPSALALLESGVAFDEARLLKRDTIDDAVPVSALSALSRGGRLTYSLADQSYSVALGELTDLDAGGTPSGNATGSVVTISSGAGKLTNYRVNDLILVAAASTSVIRRITSIASPVINLDSATPYAGDAVQLRHIASTDSTIPGTEEEKLVSYSVLTDFVDFSGTDFEAATVSDRMVVSKDGLTTLSGRSISVGSSGVVGAQRAVLVDSGLSAELRVFAPATRLDLICNGTASCTVSISIDGSPAFSATIPAGARRYTVFFNARYQSHEVVILPTAGILAVSEILLFWPPKPQLSGVPTEVADLGRVAVYEPSRAGFTSAPYRYPLGAVFYPATHHFAYENGSSATDIIGVNLAGTSNTQIEFTPLRLRGNTFLTPLSGASTLLSISVDVIAQIGEVSAANVICKVWSTSGGIPSAVVATSTNSFVASSLATSYGTPSLFTFAPASLAENTTYAWTVEVDAPTTSPLLLRLDSGDPYASGTSILSDDGGASFTTVSGTDNTFWAVNLQTNIDWQVQRSYSKTPWLKYIVSGNPDATAEFFFLGSAFELQYIIGPDHGIFKVYVDGTPLDSVIGATIVGDYTGNQVDAYSVSYSRANIGAYGLTFGYHRITASIENPRTKNPSASGYNMAFTGLYVANQSGTLTLSLDRGVFSSLHDLRPFSAVDTPLEDQAELSDGSFATGITSLSLGSSSQAVSFSTPFPDVNYVVTCNFRNTSDAYPSFQPIVITAQSASGFTASWNAPLPSANYELIFLARSLS